MAGNYSVTMPERKWEPAIYVALAFLGTFFLYDPYAI